MSGRFPIHAEAQPPPELAPFVECYWNVSALDGETPDEPEVQRVLPDGSITLMFNLGAPHRLHDPDDPTRWTLSRRCWLAGFQTDYLVISPTDGTHMVGVRFRPGGVYPFFRIPLSEFGGQVIEMDQVWGLEGERVCQQLAEAETLQERFERVSSFLVGRARGQLLLERRVDYCVRRLHADPHQALGDILPGLGISGKQLNRLFQKHVGVNPKSVQKVERFQSAIRMLESGKSNWLDVALDNGFYDQAHFISDFKRFTGVTPTQYLDKRTPYLNFLAL